MSNVYYWLAAVNDYGVPDELCDGPHDDISGVERALDLYNQFGFDKNSEYCVVKVQTVSLKSHVVRCGDCGEQLQKVRPGKYQCPRCE